MIQLLCASPRGLQIELTQGAAAAPSPSFWTRTRQSQHTESKLARSLPKPGWDWGIVTQIRPPAQKMKARQDPWKKATHCHLPRTGPSGSPPGFSCLEKHLGDRERNRSFQSHLGGDSVMERSGCARPAHRGLRLVPSAGRVCAGGPRAGTRAGLAGPNTPAPSTCSWLSEAEHPGLGGSH